MNVYHIPYIRCFCVSSFLFPSYPQPNLYTGFPRLLENLGIITGKFPGPGKSWKMTLVLESPGNLLARSWKVLKFARQWCTWQFLVSNRHVYADENTHNCIHRYVFWAAGMPKMLSWPVFLPGPRWQSLQRSPRLLSCCLLLYLNIASLRRLPGKMLLGAWKSPGIFLTKRVGTLFIRTSSQTHIPWYHIRCHILAGFCPKLNDRQTLVIIILMSALLTYWYMWNYCIVYELTWDLRFGYL